MIAPTIVLPRSVIALICTLLQICFGTVYAWSFFQSLLVSQLGWTFLDTAWAFSIAIFSLGISAAWAGQALPRLGPRKLATAGSVMFAGGYVIAGLALHLGTLWLFYLGYGVIGGAGIGLGYVTPVATVAKWFPDRKGLATGIVVMGFGLGAFLLSKVLAPFLVIRMDGEPSAHLHVAGHRVRLHPAPVQPGPEQPSDSNSSETGKPPRQPVPSGGR